jgi:hypothetical protein
MRSARPIRNGALRHEFENTFLTLEYVVETVAGEIEERGGTDGRVSRGGSTDNISFSGVTRIAFSNSLKASSL